MSARKIISLSVFYYSINDRWRKEIKSAAQISLISARAYENLCSAQTLSISPRNISIQMLKFETKY